MISDIAFLELFQNLSETASPELVSETAFPCHRISGIDSDRGVPIVISYFPSNFRIHTRDEAHEQYSLLDTIFTYILYFGPRGPKMSTLLDLGFFLKIQKVVINQWHTL